jgi:hypothetical protein
MIMHRHLTERTLELSFRIFRISQTYQLVLPDLQREMTTITIRLRITQKRVLLLSRMTEEMGLIIKHRNVRNRLHRDQIRVELKWRENRMITNNRVPPIPVPPIPVQVRKVAADLRCLLLLLPLPVADQNHQAVVVVDEVHRRLHHLHPEAKDVNL